MKHILTLLLAFAALAAPAQVFNYPAQGPSFGGNNVMTGPNRFTGPVTITNSGNVFAGAAATVTSASSSSVALTVKAAASQSADLVQFRNSANVVLAAIKVPEATDPLAGAYVGLKLRVSDASGIYHSEFYQSDTATVIYSPIYFHLRSGNANNPSAVIVRSNTDVSWQISGTDGSGDIYPGYDYSNARGPRIYAGSRFGFFINGSNAKHEWVRDDRVDGSNGRVVLMAKSSGVDADIAAVSGAGLAVRPAIANAKVGGVIFDHYTDAATSSVDGTEDNLYSNTLAASLLGNNGDKVTQVEHVSFAAHATAERRLRKYFAGTEIYDSGALTLAAGADLSISTFIIRESASVVRVMVTVVTTSVSTVPYVARTRITGLTLSNSQILKTTGTASGVGAAAADIVNTQSTGQWLPAF